MAKTLCSCKSTRSEGKIKEDKEILRKEKYRYCLNIEYRERMRCIRGYYIYFMSRETNFVERFWCERCYTLNCKEGSERERESRFISVRRNVMADYKQVAYLHWPIE